MCGIIGSFRYKKSDNHEVILRQALKMMSNRGPNDSGVTTRNVGVGELVFGHARLSIIDLSSAGHQPMSTSCGRFTVVYNGEIYNYRELRAELIALGHHFHSESDTEVLLAAWGEWAENALNRFVGMYAFAIFDAQLKKLTLARDPFGIKPLYYARSETEFVFGSEILPLSKIRMSKSKINMQRAFDYIRWGGYDDSADSFIQDITHLLPGHLIEVSLTDIGSAIPKRWWWPSVVEAVGVTFDDAADELRELFLQSIRLHLRSDVALGAALSGGLDSSAVVCGMRHVEREIPIHTFSFVARGTEVNEEPWVDVVNQHVNAIDHKIVLSSDQFNRDLDSLILAQGEPFGSTSIYAQYRVFQLARESGVTVTLDGQGADELLAGYNGYPHARIRSLIQTGEFAKALRFVEAWSNWPGRSLRQGIKIGASEILPDWVTRSLRRLRSGSTPSWLDQSVLENLGISSEPLMSERRAIEGRHLVSELRSAATLNGLPALLRHADRNSMRWSIESRVPFLNAKLAEFLLRLPEEFLISDGGETKSVFRRAMRGIVPDVILSRKDKVGFYTPEQQWLRESASVATISSDVLHRVGFFRTKQLKEFMSEQISGRIAFSFQTWRIINFCRWVQLNDYDI